MRRDISKSSFNRGLTIVEALLYVAVAASVLIFTSTILEDQRQQQNRRLVASELRTILDSTQLYVARDFDAIRRQLFDDAAVTGAASAIVGTLAIEDVVDAGFLPGAFSGANGALNQLYGQTYAIIARAALRSSPDTVPSVADLSTPASVVSGTFTIKPELIDGLFVSGTNDEFDLEIVLVTVQGPDALPIPPQDGNRIVELTERLAAGYVGNVDGSATRIAQGVFGGWELDLLPFASLEGVAPNGEVQVLASLVAVPTTGAVAVVGAARDAENFSRCATIPTNIAAYGECLDDVVANSVYSSIVFNAWDSDGDGITDVIPSIEGVGGIAFAGSERTITNLSGVSCREYQPDALAADKFKVDCDRTELSGALLARDVVFAVAVGEWNFASSGEVALTSPECPDGTLATLGASLTGFRVASSQALQSICPKIDAAGKLTIVGACTDRETGMPTSCLGTVTYSVDAYCTATSPASPTLDCDAPSGQTVAWTTSPVDGDNATAAAFAFNGAEVGATYSYTITSSVGGAPVKGGGTITSPSQTVSGIDVSDLLDGILTLSVTLTDTQGNSAAPVSATTTKAAGIDCSDPATVALFSPVKECTDGTIYAGVTPDGDVPMFTTPADQSDAAYWGTHIYPTGSTSAITGEANTSDIYMHVMAGDGSYNPNDGYTPNASALCAELSAHGHDDWYLPGRTELNILYTNRTAIGGFNTNVSDPKTEYWSSTEAGQYGAFVQNFGNGGSRDVGKSFTMSVRCVRK